MIYKKAARLLCLIWSTVFLSVEQAAAEDPEPITCAGEKTSTAPVPIHLFVNEPWLSNIRDGKKRVEGRAGTLKDFSCWIGQEATFYNKSQKVTVQIVDVRHYNTLQEFLSSEGWQNVAPHLHNIDEVKAAYLSFYPGTYIDKAGGMNGIVISVANATPSRKIK